MDERLRLVSFDGQVPSATVPRLTEVDLERQGDPARRSPDTSSTAFLDGLRGLAAFFVFIQHCIGGFDANDHEHGFGEDGHWHMASLPFLRILFSGGGAAVAIFFVLSGYVLSKSPLRMVRDDKRDACRSSLVSAIIRRPIRLYAPTLAVTFAFAILLHAPFRLVQELPWPQLKENVFLEVMNWVVEASHFFNPFRTHSNAEWFAYSMVVWTIPIELKGSMLIYGLLALYAMVNIAPSITVFLLSFIGVLLLQTGVWTMACFIAGLVLAYLDVYSMDTLLISRYYRCTKRTPAILHHIAFVVGLYLLSQPAHSGEPDYSLNTPGWHYLTRMVPDVYDKTQYYRYWNSWGGLLLVYSTLRIRWLQQFLNTHPLRYLGKVSFMFYMIHLPMQYMVGDRVAKMLGNVQWGTKETLWDNRLYDPDIGVPGVSSRFLLSMAVMLPIDLAVADFLTRWLDMPCVRLGKDLIRWLGLERKSSGRQKTETEGSLHTKCLTIGCID